MYASTHEPFNARLRLFLLSGLEGATWFAQFHDDRASSFSPQEGSYEHRTTWLFIDHFHHGGKLSVVWGRRR
jgi:hypothetical protein